MNSMRLVTSNVKVGNILELRGFWVGEVKWVTTSIHGMLLMFDSPKTAFLSQSFEPLCVDNFAEDMLRTASRDDIVNELSKYRNLIREREKNTESFFDSMKMYGNVDTGSPVGVPVVVNRHVGIIDRIVDSFAVIRFCRPSVSNRITELVAISDLICASEFRVRIQADVYNRTDVVAHGKLDDFERRWLKNG